MAWQDEVALKRQEQQTAKASKTLHKESIEAVDNSGKSVVDATDKLAKSEDIASLTAVVKELQRSFKALASKEIPAPVVNVNLDEKVKSLTDGIATEIEKLSTNEQDANTLEELKKLNESLLELQNDGISDNQMVLKKFEELITVTKAIKASPVVKVAPAQVSVEASKIDLAPLQDILKEYMESKQPSEVPEVEAKEVDLTEFRAQDIDNGKDKQYVGFVHPNGNWYIIENNVKENSLRYLFGLKDYSSAFAEASTYEYSLLNEAIDALTT